MGNILSKEFRENEEFKDTSERAIGFFDTFKAGQVSSNLLAESILENKAIDDTYFAYLEEENHERKVNELIWHLSERYLNDDSEIDSRSQSEGDVER